MEGRIFVIMGYNPRHRSWCKVTSFAVREATKEALIQKLAGMRRRLYKNISEKINFKSRALNSSVVLKKKDLSVDRACDIAKTTISSVAKKCPEQEGETEICWKWAVSAKLLSFCNGGIAAMFAIYASGRECASEASNVDGCIALGPLRVRAEDGKSWKRRGAQKTKTWPDSVYFDN